MIATNTRFQLRDYQRRAVDDVIAKLDRRPILVSPTGSGKTTMATEIVERLDIPTLWLAHRKELIDQAAHRLEAHGLTVGIVMSGYEPTPDAQVQVASIQTLVRRDKPPARLIIVDECHHAAADSYRNVLDAYPDAYLLGLTATPFRLDGRGLGELFGELVVAAWSDELCTDGVLHKPRVWASKAPDLRGVRVVAGDYSLGALAERTNTAELNADIVQTWAKRAGGRRTVAFAVDIEHSQAIARAFRDAGVRAEHLDGSTPRSERDAVLQRLRRGQTQVVSNCMVLTEGWDLPALECAVVARPTASLNLHLQMIGRVMRSCDGKDGAIVLDHAGNHHVHGLVTRRLNYTLSDEKVGFADNQSSIRKRKRVSSPGQPPSSRTGLLKKFIFFGYEPAKRSVVIGPVRLSRKVGDAPHALEHGGTSTVAEGLKVNRKKRRIKIAARPFMGPAFNKEQPKLPAMWAGSVK